MRFHVRFNVSWSEHRSERAETAASTMTVGLTVARTEKNGRVVLRTGVGRRARFKTWSYRGGGGEEIDSENKYFENSRHNTQCCGRIEEGAKSNEEEAKGE